MAGDRPVNGFLNRRSHVRIVPGVVALTTDVHSACPLDAFAPAVAQLMLRGGEQYRSPRRPSTADSAAERSPSHTGRNSSAEAWHARHEVCRRSKSAGLAAFFSPFAAM